MGVDSIFYLAFGVKFVTRYDTQTMRLEMIKVALIGASGNVGARLLQELSNRGHEVTAIGRSPEKIIALPNVTVIKGGCKRRGVAGEVG